MAGLARTQARRGYDVRVVTLERGPTGARLPAGRDRGVEWVRVPRAGPQRYPFARGLRHALGTPDLVHAHGLGGVTDQLAGGPVPVGVSTHGGFGHTPELRLLKAAWIRTVVRRTLGAVDAVWFTSVSDRDQLAPARRDGLVLPNGIDMGRWLRIPRAPEVGTWVVIGRVDRHKGIDDLLDVMGCMRRPPRVRVIGPHPDPDLVVRLQQCAAERGVGGLVSFDGPVSAQSLERALSTAEIAVFPSRAEGFGIAVTEAMAAGVPVVASSIAAHREQVVDGVSGYVVDLRASGAAERLAGLVGEDHQRVAARGQRAAARFAWTRVADAYDRAYSQVLAS